MKPVKRTDAGAKHDPTRHLAIKYYFSWLHNENQESVRHCAARGHPLSGDKTGRHRGDKSADGWREPDVRTGKNYRIDKPLQSAKVSQMTCLDCVKTLAAIRQCLHGDCLLWPWCLRNPDKTVVFGEELNRGQANTNSKTAGYKNNQIALLSGDTAR